MRFADDYRTSEDKPSTPEPLMPGADTPPSEPTKHYNGDHHSEKDAEEVIARARIQKGADELKDHSAKKKVLILFPIFLGLFFLTMELDFLPNELIVLTMLLPTLVGMGIRVFARGMSLRDAAAECKVHIVLSIGYLAIGIMCLF